MEIGRFAISKAGHDKGTIYVVLAYDEKYLTVVDGKNKAIHHPKKKSYKHIQMTNDYVDTALQEKLAKQQAIYDEEIKYAIKQYINKK